MTAVSRNACWGYKDSYWADRRVALCLVILLLRRSPSSGWTRMTMAHKGISHVRGKILHYNGALSLGWDLYNYFTSRLRPLGGSKPCTPHDDSCSVRYLGARALPVWRDGLPILPKLIFDEMDFYIFALYIHIHFFVKTHLKVFCVYGRGRAWVLCLSCSSEHPLLIPLQSIVNLRERLSGGKLRMTLPSTPLLSLWVCSYLSCPT